MPPSTPRASTISAPVQSPLGRLAGRLDGFDWLVLGLLALQSMWLVVLLLGKQGADHIWIGADGTRVTDQMQYLGWVQNAGHGGWISNSFQIAPSKEIYLHPGFVVSGALTRAGLNPGYAYLLWKPIAVFCLFVAVRAYVRRVLHNVWQRRVALVLALFSITPAAAFLAAIGRDQNADSVDSVNFELWPGRYLWGYPFTAIAVAALIGALLVYERDRIDPRVRFTAPLLGLVCGWLQPWQGATAIVILVVAEAVHYRRRPGNVSLLVLTVVATSAPLLYYAYLSRKDASWELFTTRNHGDLYSWFAVAASIGLLAVPAVLAYRHVGDTFQAVAVRVWPVAAIAVYAAIGITNKATLPGHALQGLTVPLAVLAVLGFATIQFEVPRVALAGLVLVLIGVLIVPGILRELRDARAVATNPASPFFVRDNNHDALEYLADNDESGGVIAPVEFGQVVPGLTARNTWVGLPSWTPDYALRAGIANILFSGGFAPATAQQVVRDSGARFVLSDCAHRRVDLTPALRPILVATQRFGCATVYEVARAGRGEVMAETQRWFFVHVQKTAGTALWRRLKQQFAETAVYPGPGDGDPPRSTLSVEHLIERWNARRPDIRIVTGHFPLCTAELLDAPFTTLTILRDPVDRTLSNLRHYREETPAEADRPLEQIYDDPVRFEIVHNHIVKMFSLSCDEMTDGTLTPVDFTPERLARAKDRLATVDVVGFQADFEQFCAELVGRFGWDLGRPIFMNRTQPVDVAQSFRDRIAADNADDVELYEFARGLRPRHRS